MGHITNIICPYLKGTAEGARCGAADKLVREIDGLSIKLCMSRHYEVCALYFTALKESVVRPPFRSQAGAK